MNRWFAFGLSGHGERTAKYSLFWVKRTNFVALTLGATSIWSRAFNVLRCAVMLNFV
jgi:hypothetical protein